MEIMSLHDQTMQGHQNALVELHGCKSYRIIFYCMHRDQDHACLGDLEVIFLSHYGHYEFTHIL